MEKIVFKCEFCGVIVKSQDALDHHQKESFPCLKIQVMLEEYTRIPNIVCIYCDIDLTNIIHKPYSQITTFDMLQHFSECEQKRKDEERYQNTAGLIETFEKELKQIKTIELLNEGDSFDPDKLGDDFDYEEWLSKRTKKEEKPNPFLSCVSHLETKKDNEFDD